MNCSKAYLESDAQSVYLRSALDKTTLTHSYSVPIPCSLTRLNNKWRSEYPDTGQNSHSTVIFSLVVSLSAASQIAQTSQNVMFVDSASVRHS